MKKCFKLTKLPSDFYKLVSLRHLNLDGCKIKKMPKQIGNLNHLQTLSDFVVGEENGSNIQELGNLNRLQGKLCISGLEHVINPKDAAGANLKDKKLLPPTLDTLVLRNCSKLRKMNNKGFLHLKSLKTLCIFNCPSLESLPEKEALPNSLLRLSIEDCPIKKEKYEKEGGELLFFIQVKPHSLCLNYVSEVEFFPCVFLQCCYFASIDL